MMPDLSIRYLECINEAERIVSKSIANEWTLDDEVQYRSVETLAEAARLLAGGRKVRWCRTHQAIAWEDFEEGPSEEFVSRGDRCPSADWIEGAASWDCVTSDVLIVEIGEE